MRKGETEEVIRIMLSADGGCEYCVADLLQLFCTRFPDYKMSIEKYLVLNKYAR